MIIWIKDALCSYREGSNSEEFSKLNKETPFNVQHNFIVFYFVYIWRTPLFSVKKIKISVFVFLPHLYCKCKNSDFAFLLQISIIIIRRQ